MVYSSKQENRSYFLGFFIVFVIVSLNALGQYFKQQQIVTLGLLPLLSIIAFQNDIYNFKSHKKEFYVFILIFILSFITAFIYVNYDAYSRNFSLFLGAVLSSYIAIGLNKKYNYESFFHIGYVLSIIFLFIIMYINGNINFSNFSSVVDYRDRFMLNANAYSYYSLFANFSLFYLYLKNKNKLYSILLVILPILFLIIAFTTQSRSGLYLIVLVNIVFWLFINKSETSSKVKKLVRKILFTIIFLIVAIKFIDIYQNSRIKGRISNYSNGVDPREVLIKEGVQIFYENPILGVGLGQFPFYNRYGLFSHNSYVEILAEQGVIGGFFLFILFGMALFKSFKNLKKDKTNEILRCNLFFFLIFIIYNNVYVFYKFPFSMMYFFLIITIQNKYEELKNADINITDN